MKITKLKLHINNLCHTYTIKKTSNKTEANFKSTKNYLL